MHLGVILSKHGTQEDIKRRLSLAIGAFVTIMEIHQVYIEQCCSNVVAVPVCGAEM